MECSCSCEVDTDSNGFSQTEMRRAAKVHCCCECGNDIVKGELHEHSTGVYDGGWYRYRTCLGCQRIRDDLCRCGFYYGSLREITRECLGFDYVTGDLERWAAEEDRAFAFKGAG